MRWVGYLSPAMRVDAALLAQEGSSPLTVTISLLPGVTSSPARSAIADSGGQVVSALGGQDRSLRAVLTPQGIRSLAAQPAVIWIEPYVSPRLWNDVARSIMSVPPVWTSHGLRGEGEIIAIADTGLDAGSAVSLTLDLRGRVVAAYALGRPGDWSDPDGHGTHVAGSALGNGVRSGSAPGSGDYGQSHAGIAPEASLVCQSVLDASGGLGDLPADLTALFQQAYDDGARVHSNSWGVALGDGGHVYDSYAQQVDRFAWEHPEMVIVFAAGNDGEDANRDGVVDPGSVTAPATAKNALSVGASESVRHGGGYGGNGPCTTWGECWPEDFPAPPLSADALSNDASGMAAFSSRGPAPDGRMKPDLVAPGTNIISTRSSLASLENYWGIYDDDYAYCGGTSMAAPLVAGASALLRQYYRTMDGHTPSAALVKATLLAGAADLNPGQYAGRVETPAAPNNVEGWGRLDLTNALFPLPPRRVVYSDAVAGLSSGQTAVYSYTVASSAVPLRIVLAWTDYPGSLLAAPNLVNDLDLQVTGPLTGSTGMDNGRAPDRVNNVEGVMIGAPQPGVYRVVVSGHNIPMGPQPYALVVSANLLETPAPPSLSLTSAPGFGVAGTTIPVMWAVSRGTVITTTELLWDRQSHAVDRLYGNAVAPLSASGRNGRLR